MPNTMADRGALYATTAISLDDWQGETHTIGP